MARKTTIIAGQTFSSRVKAEDYVRKVLESLEETKEITSEDPSWHFFHELIERHPDYSEKYGPGIKKFLIGRSFRNHIELNLLRVDGSKMDISWLTCVSGKPTSIEANLKEAMRVAIEDQIDHFRKSEFEPTKKCEECGNDLISIEDTHVDHEVHFQTLVKEFQAMYGPYPTIFDDESMTHRAKFKPSDAKFSESWKQFHKEKAKLRLLHVRCNLTRKKAQK